MAYIIAYDLGTGGIKASLHDERGTSLHTSFLSYDTRYPQPRWHEQKPLDWWNGVCASTAVLLEKSGAAPGDIVGLAVSGHSLVAAPLDAGGELLCEYVPIWSDTRATAEAAEFFREVDYADWYGVTGNGDPAECYSVMKLMWMRRHQPEAFSRAAHFLGSKDYVNFRLTGKIATDPSYASGTGLFNLLAWRYEDRFIEAAGLPKEKLPAIVPSHAPVGLVTAEAARATGLREGTRVYCGGVDNTCMALGARGIGDERIYTSVGSSCWIALTSRTPIIDHALHPFIFAHAVEGYYTSGMSIFSGGSSYKWVRNQLCRDIAGEVDAFPLMNELAAGVPPGSNGLIFNPSLAGGSLQEKSPYIAGAFLGMSLATTREDMIRATLEGVCLNLRVMLDGFENHVHLPPEMLLCGGGSKSLLWRRIFADIYDKTIVKTNIDQDAASLGAAAMAALGSGMWDSYAPIDSLHEVEAVSEPTAANRETYRRLLDHFVKSADFLSQLGEEMRLDRRELS